MGGLKVMKIKKAESPWEKGDGPFCFGNANSGWFVAKE